MNWPPSFVICNTSPKNGDVLVVTICFPAPPLTKLSLALSKENSHPATKSTNTCSCQFFCRQPIVTGTSVVAIKYDGGVIMSTDCLGTIIEVGFLVLFTRFANFYVTVLLPTRKLTNFNVTVLFPTCKLVNFNVWLSCFRLANSHTRKLINSNHILSLRRDSFLRVVGKVQRHAANDGFGPKDPFGNLWRHFRLSAHLPSTAPIPRRRNVLQWRPPDDSQAVVHCPCGCPVQAPFRKQSTLDVECDCRRRAWRLSLPGMLRPAWDAIPGRFNCNRFRCPFGSAAAAKGRGWGCHSWDAIDWSRSHCCCGKVYESPVLSWCSLPWQGIQSNRFGKSFLFILLTRARVCFFSRFKWPKLPRMVLSLLSHTLSSLIGPLLESCLAVSNDQWPMSSADGK